MERVQCDEYAQYVSGRNLLQPAPQWLEHVQRVLDDSNVLWGNLLQPPHYQILERGQSGGFLGYVRWCNLLPPIMIIILINFLNICKTSNL